MWTPTALRCELGAYAGRVWRIVEAQHRISTNRLADSAAEQALLEQLIEEKKPRLPQAARGLHYLLSTPFRYGYPVASRFRRADVRPGVLYASEHEATAVAETAYWRLRFFSRSPTASPPRTLAEFSAFTFEVHADRLIDLTTPPLDRDRASWIDPDDYGACQALADGVRGIDGQAIRYESARDSSRGANLAVFDPASLAGARLRFPRTWHMRIERGRLSMTAAFPSTLAFSFTPTQFGLPALPAA